MAESSSSDPRERARTDAVAWLDTVGADAARTIAEATLATIEPAFAPPSTGGTRALEHVVALANDPHQLRLGDVIGEGGMGVVRSAEQVALGRTVAVKALRSDKHDPSTSLALLREAWITGALEHPNVVPVHSLELAPNGMPSIVLKRIEGIEWSKLIANPDEVARRFGATDLLAWNLAILLQVINAVRFAHRHGILHRDLKPANVMIGDFGEVYLLDWGIAVSLRDDGTGRFPLASHANQLAGTPAYMAPEMLGRCGGPPLSERTDVYLAGAVLHEIIAGHPPHRGSNAIAVIASVIASRPELPANAPPELARICARAMHDDPEQRHESADALWHALQRYLGHRGSERLGELASTRLDELRALLRTKPSPDDVYRLFGACRYGFRDAVAAWPENERAARGLVDAVVAVATYELEAGRPQAAISLLGELESPPPLLERAREEAAKQQRRVEELERIERDHDRSIGTRTRMFVTTVLGVAFTVLPLVLVAFPEIAASHAVHVGGAVVITLLLTATAVWARETMRATAFNRQVTRSVRYLFVMQAVLSVGAWLAGVPGSELYTWYLLLYTMFVGMLAITMEPYLWFGALLLGAGFLVAARDHGLALYMIGAGNAVTCGIAAWRWKPASQRYERGERG